jgi:hypothetical protein
MPKDKQCDIVLLYTVSLPILPHNCHTIEQGASKFWQRMSLTACNAQSTMLSSYFCSPLLYVNSIGLAHSPYQGQGAAA